MRGAIPVSGRLNPTWAIKPGAITFHSIEGSLSFAHTLSRKMVEKKAKKKVMPMLLSEIFLEDTKYKSVFLKDGGMIIHLGNSLSIEGFSKAPWAMATKTLCLPNQPSYISPIHWLLFNHKHNTIFEKQTAVAARLKSKQSVLRDNPMVERKQRMMMMVTPLSVPAQPHCEATTTSVLSFWRQGGIHTVYGGLKKSHFVRKNTVGNEGLTTRRSKT